VESTSSLLNCAAVGKFDSRIWHGVDTAALVVALLSFALLIPLTDTNRPPLFNQTLKLSDAICSPGDILSLWIGEGVDTVKRFLHAAWGLRA